MKRSLGIATAFLFAASPVLAHRAPAPAAVHIAPEVLSQACAPATTFEAPAMPLRISGSQEGMVRRTFAPGDLVTINAGSDNGIDVGQEYFARRPVPIERRPIGRDNPATIQTAGWIRIYAVDRRMSLATIVHACTALELNDYLEPFALPAVPAPSADRPFPQRGNYGRVLRGNDNRIAFAAGDHFLVDRGSDHGVTVGAQFVVYRDNQEPGNFLFEIGEAVAVDVRPEASTLRIILARDAFLSGDYVALRK